MSYVGGGIFGISIVVGIIFGVFLVILWILLPFAVFGIKKRLDKVLVEAQKMNAHLGEINAAQRRTDSPLPPIRAER